MIRTFEGHIPQIGERVYLDPACSVIGEVTLGDDVSVWPFTVIRGDVNRIRVGDRTNIQDGSILHVTHDGPFSRGGLDLSIGADVTIGHGAILHACTVGDECLIGMGACVMDGAVVEDGSMVAAGALVSPRTIVRSGTLFRGSPAREARRLKPEELEMLPYSSAHYVRLKDRYLAGEPVE